MFASRSSRDLASQASASPPRSHRKGETPVKRENNSYGGTPARKGPRPSFITDTERVHRKKPSISFADLEYDDKFKTIAHRKQGKTITVLGQYVRLAPSPFPPPHFSLLLSPTTTGKFQSRPPHCSLGNEQERFYLSVSSDSSFSQYDFAHSFNNSRSAFFHHSLFFPSSLSRNGSSHLSGIVTHVANSNWSRRWVRARSALYIRHSILKRAITSPSSG